jgi:cytochrome P450
VCIGNQFAMTEMVLVIATLLQNLRFELAPDQGPVKLVPRLSLRPEGGIRLRVTWRHEEARKSNARVGAQNVH